MLIDKIRVEDALILVVDDQPVNRQLIEATLRVGGFRQIMTAEDGRSALEAVKARPPDCIILDVMMPEMNGFTVCRKLREDPQFERVPVIIQTALTGIDDRRQAFSSGASDVVTKPFDPKEMLARVRVHVSSSMLSRALLAYREVMTAELSDARALAETLLPSGDYLTEMSRRGLTFDSFHRPSFAIGGDLWTAWPTEGGKLALFVGDVSGHGVSAALRAFALHALLIPPPPFSELPITMAAHLDNRLHQHGSRHGHFVAGMFGVFDPATRVMEYVGAGLRDGFVLRRDGAMEQLAMSGLPFGLVSALPRSGRSVRFEAGDTLILFSDAMVECSTEWAPQDEAALRDWFEATRVDWSEHRGTLASFMGERFMHEFGEHVADDLLIVSGVVA